MTYSELRDYWYRQYDYYNKQNNKLKTQKRDLSTYLTTLGKLSTNIENAHNDLVEAEKKYADGGYIDGDQTLDHGTLKKIYNLLETDKQVADSIKSRVSADITAMEQAIEYNNSIVSTYYSYYMYYYNLCEY